MKRVGNRAFADLNQTDAANGCPIPVRRFKVYGGKITQEHPAYSVS